VAERTSARVRPGDRITWRQYVTPGEGWVPAFERSGTVWSDAPVGNGLSSAWWVMPDEPLPGEVLAGGALVVGKAAGAWRDWTSKDGPDTGPAKGEVYSSSYWRQQPAALTASAASVQARYRKTAAQAA
jgi:hypothetical protein